MFQWIRGLAFAALLVGGPAAAQTSPEAPKEPGEIVVNGNRDRGREIRDFVGALTPAPFDGQLSRFEEWAVCPLALGFKEPAREAIVARLRKVAEAVGIRVGKPGCRSNVAVIATSDKKAFLTMLSQKHHEYFEGMTPAEVREIVRAPGPATAWQLQGVPLDSDGVELPVDPDTGYYRNDTTNSPSRITLPVRPHFSAAVVVLDSKALVGLTPIEVADYTAMRAYAKTDPARLTDKSPPTILKVLDATDGAEVPVTLTRWDLAFLRALYASAPNLYASGQRSDMRRRVEKELDGPEERRK